MAGPSVLVSVAIATRRGGPWLNEALESVWLQNIDDLEVVVVDDGVPGGLEPAIRSDRRVRVVEAGGQGIALARNIAQSVAAGEFIAVLDDDDRWLAGKLTAQLALLQDNGDAGMCHTGFEVIDESGRFLGPGWAGPLEVADVLTSHALWLHSTTVWRRSCLQSVGGYSPRFVRAVDLDVVLKVLGRWPTVFEPAVLAQYRVHGDRASSPLSSSYRRSYRNMAWVHYWRQPRLQDLVERAGGRATNGGRGALVPPASRSLAVEGAVDHAAEKLHQRRLLKAAGHLAWAARVDLGRALSVLETRGSAWIGHRVAALGREDGRLSSPAEAGPGDNLAEPKHGEGPRPEQLLRRRESSSWAGFSFTGTGPVVSVAITGGEAEGPLDESMDSVWLQDVSDVELVLVGGGMDEAVSPGLRRDRRVRVLDSAQRGPALDRNIALSAARGRAVAFLERGDYWAKGKLAGQLELLSANPEAAMCFTDFELVPGPRSTHGGETTLQLGIASAFGVAGFGVVPSTMLWQRPALMALGGYDPDLNGAEDLDLVLSARERWPIVRLPQALSYCRLRPASSIGYRARFALMAAVLNNHLRVQRDWGAEMGLSQVELPFRALRKSYAEFALRRCSECAKAGDVNEAASHLRWALKLYSPVIVGARPRGG